MNGKGSTARPFSVNFTEFSENLEKCISNPHDLYRKAVMNPDFSQKYPSLTGNWGNDREEWIELLTFGGH